MANILLTISLLASNRKETIERCIESLCPIREAVSTELIIVDTGCAEELHEELCKTADQVVMFTWCNDFSAARNAGLKKANGQWFLYLDDDEWFTDSQPIIDFFQNGEYLHYGAADYIQRNYLDTAGSQYSDSWVARMIRLDVDTHFESKIHEHLAPIKGEEKALHAIVDHYGYVYPDQEAKQKHFERNKTLLEEMIAEEPEQIRWKLQLLLEYRTMEAYEELELLGKQLLESCGVSLEYELAYDMQVYLGSFYAAVIISELGKENYEEVRKWCQKALEDKRNVEWSQAFLCFSLARSSFFLGKYIESEKYANEYLNWKRILQEDLGTDENQKQYFFEQEKAPFINETFDEVKQKEIYSILICAGLKQKDTTNLQKYLTKLGWEKHHLYVFEKMAESLIEAMCKDPLNPVNEKIYAEVLQLMYKNQALWQYIVQEICAYEETGHETGQIVQLIRVYVPEAIEQEQVESVSDEAIDTSKVELQQLAEQVKEQVRMLIANGMKEQAKEVIMQLQKLLPDDQELQEIRQKMES